MNEMRGLNGFAAEVHEHVRARGFWAPGEAMNIGEKLMMIVGELSEAHDEYRRGYALGLIEYEHQGPDLRFFRSKNPVQTYTNVHGAVSYTPGKPVGFPIELADSIIRTMDLLGALGIDVEEAIRIKMDYDATRPHRHGGKIV